VILFVNFFEKYNARLLGNCLVHLCQKRYILVQHTSLLMNGNEIATNGTSMNQIEVSPINISLKKSFRIVQLWCPKTVCF